MGKKTPPPKPPDLKPISDAQIKIAEQANELAREQMGLSKEQFEYYKVNAAEELALAKEQADRAFGLQEQALASSQQAQEFAQQVGQVQMDAMNQQMGYAQEDRARYKDVFLPMQDQYIEEAQAYDTPERREAEAARQMVDVQRQADAQRANADARLRAMGVDPSQVSSGALMQQLGTATAANQALAGNFGRQNIEDRGRSMREAAINLGNGLPVQSQAGYGGSTNSGNSAMGAALGGQGAQLGAINAATSLGGQGLAYRQNALQSSAQLTGSPTQWAGIAGNSMGLAGNQYNNAANTMTQGFNNSLASWQAGQNQAQQNFSNIMSVGSMAAGMMMAEGGAVHAAEGGGIGGAIGSLMKKGGDAAKKGGDWKERAKARLQESKIKFKRSGEDGEITMEDRYDNGITAAKRWAEVESKGDATEAAESKNILSQIYAAEGGRAIPRRQSRDKIPAMLSEGEYVVPADVVNAIGINHLDKLVKKYHRSNA
jgi:hypothetical protein